MESELSDTDSDEWANEELVLPPIIRTNHTNTIIHRHNDDGSIDSESQQQDISYWDVVTTTETTSMVPTDNATTSQTSRSIEPSQDDSDDQGGYPMFLVNMTRLSDGVIHSKFDINSVNDPMAVKVWRTKVERNYTMYASDASLLANRTIIPCGSTVWSTALQNLRREEPGIYYCPIFPPKEAKQHYS